MALRRLNPAAKIIAMSGGRTHPRPRAAVSGHRAHLRCRSDPGKAFYLDRAPRRRIRSTGRGLRPPDPGPTIPGTVGRLTRAAGSFKLCLVKLCLVKTDCRPAHS
jgi:hypothetical protein